MSKRGSDRYLNSILLYLVLFLLFAIIVVMVFKEKIFVGGA